MAKILLTGSFGNVGTSALEEFIRRKYDFVCFDFGSERNKKTARKFKKLAKKSNMDFEIVWGDMRDRKAVAKAVSGVDVVVHLAGIIPPLAYEKPEYARAVNVGGTKNLVRAMEASEKKPKLIFTSSVAVYGDRRKSKPPVKVNSLFDPHDNYSKHKVECENFIRKSKLEYCIFRLGVVTPLSVKIDPLMFEVPLDTRIGFVHTKDVGLAIANGVQSRKIWGKTLLIEGGEKCRMTYRVFVGTILGKLGIGMFPKSAFGNKPFHCDYMETRESQKLLRYQTRKFKDFLGEVASVARKKGLNFAIFLFRPFVRAFLLLKSKYYDSRDFFQFVRDCFSRKEPKAA